ncbi:phosphate regulon transcriptional regulator PhoB [uncultured Halovibrio sp.]|uniref:phosphate regulon transcriptional regulator PhoB n=1 Tax=uncultured Halovibrio sp. TaxID=985049 RepID=UPI0025D51D15|nr:phosphate regulon transcriptional regulator PhoB [uncultured Halovibrio sp.]
MQATILLVEDEPEIQEMVSRVLAREGFDVQLAGDSSEAHQRLAEQVPDLMLVDWMLPGTSGIDLARRLKRDEGTAEIPIIMLTARTEEDNRVQGLEVGADDYITKPFSPREMVARLKAVLRRSTPPGMDTPVEIGGIHLDPVGHWVTIDGESVNIGPTEYRLLQFFMTHPDRVYTREQLLDQVWGAGIYVEERTVDVHIRRLRKVLGEAHGKLVQTVRGAGYRFSTRQQ